MRKLASIQKVWDIIPIDGADRIELAKVEGWQCVANKGQFQKGDLAVYFEIDSRVPAERECFAFLEKRHYKVKTLKMCKTISQGLLMHPSDFGWTTDSNISISGAIIDDEGNIHYANDESRFLTKQLGVTYADEEDNQRKAAPVDKYKKMAGRHPKIFKKPFVRWLMRLRSISADRPKAKARTLL